jgi:adenylate cyclase
MLRDSDLEARDWLKTAGIRGKPVRVLKSPESGGETEARVIIREVPSAPVYYPAPVPHYPGSAVPVSDGSAEFGAEPVQTAEPAEERRPSRRIHSGHDPELKVRLSTKLILIVSSIIVVSLATTTLMGLYFFRRSLSIQSEDSNISMSAVVAKQAENELLKIINSANLLFQVGSAAGAGSALVDDFFANDTQLIYVGIPGTPLQYSSRDWFRNNRIFEEKVILAGILEARRDDLEKARGGETVVVNASPLIPNLESPVLAIAVPFLLGARQEALVILADIGNTLVESVRLQQGNSTIIVNPAGEILAVAETSRLFRGENISSTAAFEKIYTDGLDFGQIEYSETRDGVFRDYIGFYRLIRNFNLGVITTTLKADVFRDVQKIILLNVYFGLAILSISILGVFFFARSISIPVNELWLATRKIKAKQWQGAILKPRTRDEVGVLTRNFNAMVPALRATDDLLENTKVFVNEDVATMIFENRLPRTATTRDVTVFFSDVRDFTSMSEGMGDPQVVLKNLSEYFDAMVPCVRNTGGTVDKFIGDAVMAVWGSMGEPLENNAESAINGALMMRDAIIGFNRTRLKGDRMRPPFQIGCGLHSGPATVGIMGSSHKQEWAHMGPTVNLASRIEGVNKELGTDILISPETAARVSGIFHLQPMVKIHPKGVEKPVQIYTVLGRLDDNSRPRSLEELRKRLGREAYNSIGTESHGAKYKIVTD